MNNNIICIGKLLVVEEVVIVVVVVKVLKEVRGLEK